MAEMGGVACAFAKLTWPKKSAVRAQKGRISAIRRPSTMLLSFNARALSQNKRQRADSHNQGATPGGQT